MSELKERWHYQAPLPQGAIEAGQVILRDGTTAELRPVSPGDRSLIRSFLERTSVDARYHRFFGEVPLDEASDQLSSSGDLRDRAALLVLAAREGETGVIAHAGYHRDGEESAEVAFLVDDSYQGKGLATLLLERLALIAVRNGIRCFHAPTETGNVRMRDVFRSSGFSVIEAESGGQIEASLSLEPSERSVELAEIRERVATVASLQAFMKPRGVALIGASRDPSSISFRILHNLVLDRFNGPVYPVNPRASVVASMPAFGNVGTVPGPVDLAIIAVPSGGVLEVARECGEKGVRALLVISAGFAEVGAEGKRLQEELLRITRTYGMRLLGPNCLGLINTAPDVRLNASFAPSFPPNGPVAMASQSGALGLAVLDYAAELGMGLSSFVSLGNKADVSGNDLIQYWEDDPDTKVILLYLESFGNPRRFARLARRVGRSKPVVVVKAGRSSAGSRAASSHTAALAASESATQALFEQTGLIRAETLESMFDTASLLAAQELPDGPRVAVVTNAGGPGILAVDTLEAAGLEAPEASPQLRSRLAEFLPPAASTGNPIDMIASASASQYRDVLGAVLEDEGYDAVLVLFTPIGLEDTEKVAGAVLEAVGAARSQGLAKPVLTCFMGQEPEELGRSGERIPSYRFPEAAAHALGRAYRYASWKRSPLGRLPELEGIDLAGARALLRGVGDRGDEWLSAPEVRSLLTSFGLQVLGERMTSSAVEAAKAADDLGYPVAVKLASRTILHKSEWDGVKLGLESAMEVREACSAIEQRLDEAGRRDELDGFLVQKMAPAGVELMVGVAPDPLFGPLVALGLGGIHVEVLRDVVFRITPLTDRDAREMVRGIKGYRLLTGFRGAPPADVAALEETLLRVSRMVEELPEIAELDLNPVRALEPGQGCVVLDARVRLRGSAESPEQEVDPQALE